MALLLLYACDFILMVSLKYFMIRITDDLQVFIDKSFMNGAGYGCEPDRRLQSSKMVCSLSSCFGFSAKR
jgi:hypothetical protein